MTYTVTIIAALIIVSTIPFVLSYEYWDSDFTVPSWIKNNAGWWADDQINDDSFVSGIQWMITNDVIILPPTELGEGDGENVIPRWVKSTAGWWSNDEINDSTFVAALRYLIGEGIIIIEQETEVEVVEEPVEVEEVKEFHMIVNGGNCCLNWAHVGEEYRFQIETFDEFRGIPIDGVTITVKIISKGGELRYDFGTIITDDDIYINSVTIPNMDWYAENILSVTGEYNGIEKTIEKEFEVFKKKGDMSASYGAVAGDCAHSKRVTISGQESGPQGLWFSKTGEKMFLTGYSGDDINEYTLTGAYCIDTRTFVDSFDVKSQASAPTDLAFNPLGDIMYVLQAAGSEVYEYKLSVPWDVSTASHTDSFDLSTEDNQPRGIEFSKSGKIMFILGSAGDEVNQYDLSVAWDVSTASASCHPCFEISEDDELEGLAFSKAGDKMFVQGYGNDNVYEYTLSVPWDVSSASLVYTFDIPNGGGDDQARDIIFDTTGKTMFILSDSTNKINPYKLSVAWDLSSASKLW